MTSLAQERIIKTRQLVLEYLATHGISDKLNRSVNDLCRSRPRDPWLFLTDALSDHQKEAPLIDRLVARNGLTSKGELSLQLNVYGRVASNRAPKHMASDSMFLKPNNLIDNILIDNKENMNESKQDDNKNEENSNDNNASQSLENQVQSLIQHFFSPNLRDLKMSEQIKIDNELKKLNFEKLEEIEKTQIKYDVLLTLSILIAVTATKSLKKAFYQYLNQFYMENSQYLLKNNNENNNNTNDESNNNDKDNGNSGNNLASPLSNGNRAGTTEGSVAATDAPNTTNVKMLETIDDTLHLPNFMCILTKSDNFPSIGALVSESIDPIRRISMMKQLSEMILESMDKGKGSKDSIHSNDCRDEDSGAIVLNQFKKFDDLFKFIKECVDKCKFEEKEKIENNGDKSLFTFAIIVDSKNGFRKYDPETNKYTVFGEKKPMDNGDLASYYQKMVSNYNEIGYLENGMDRSDTVGYSLLCTEFEELSDRVTIVGNDLYCGNLEKIDTGFQQKWTHSVLVPNYYINTITNIFEISKTVDHLCFTTNRNGKRNILQSLMIEDIFDNNESEPYFVDLAVACRCGVIRFPLPNMKHGTKKYNRWLFLNDELKATNDAALKDIVHDTKPPNSQLPPTEEEEADHEALP